MPLMKDEDGFIYTVKNDYFSRYAALDQFGMTEEQAIQAHLDKGWSFATPEDLLPEGYLDKLVSQRASLTKRDLRRMLRQLFERFDQFDEESLRPMERRLAEKIDIIGRGSDGNQLDRLSKKDWYTVEEVAKETGRSGWQVRKWFREGRVEAKKTGSDGWRVSYQELVRYKHEGLREPSV